MRQSSIVEIIRIAWAIWRFERMLPGWWYSVGLCSVSADASCGPDRNGSDAPLLAIKQFDEGFHCDIRQPASMANSLRLAMREAIEARKKYYS